ncbi:MAG: hypothetical protein A2V66_12360 [Ignavibacteria bacterium RBG_13_36_8]|nr:MAG: hypothetical protein A2V66_12360 [Ignavibacteria bacterium RBG_13_36_8]
MITNISTFDNGISLLDSKNIVPYTANNHYQSASDKILTFLACLWIVAASLGPDSTFLGIIKIRPEDIITIIMSIIVIFKMHGHKVNFYSFQLTFKIILFSISLCIISILSAYIHSLSQEIITYVEGAGTFGYPKNLEIMKEIIRFVKYILVAFAFSQVSEGSWKYVLNSIIISCFIMIGIQLFQFIMPDVINLTIKEIFVEGNVADNEDILIYSGESARETREFRTGSIMINPNVFGAYLIAPLFIVTMKYFEYLNSPFLKDRKNRLVWLSISCITILGLFLTQSRTMLISIVLAMITTLMFVPHTFRRKISRFIIVVIIISTIFTVIFSDFTYRYSLDGLEKGLMQESFNKKVDWTLDAINSLGYLIVIGTGPAGAAFVDNEFGLILLWYGLIGYLMYLIFYYSLYAHVSRRIKNIYQRAAFRGILIAYLIGSVGASFFFNNRVFPVFIALLSLACAKSVQMPRRTHR